MKKTSKITFCGISASLAVVFMLFSYFPYLTYAIPAIAGLFMMMMVIEIDEKWAFGAYIASAILIFLFAEPESKLMYICLFGYYPILKAVIERMNKPVIEWICKIVVFNLAVLVIYLFFSKVFDISVDDFNKLGQYGAYIFLAVGNIAFVIYDIAFSRLASFYMEIIHPKVKKLMRF